MSRFFRTSVISKVLLQDLQNLGAQNVCLMTDRNLARLPPVKAVLESLAKNRVRYKVYDNVRVEPTDTRWDSGERAAL